MKKILFPLSLIIAVPLLAQGGAPTKPGAIDLGRITAGIYKTDPQHTLIGWTVDHFGFTDYFGTIGSANGTLVLDPAKPEAASVSVDIPTSEIFTANAKLNEHLKSANFFDVANFGTARFVSTKVVVNGTKATISGNLTIKGITKPVTLDARFTGAGVNPYTKKETVGFSAAARIKRSDWGINFLLPIVGDEVDLKISAPFEKAV